MYPDPFGVMMAAWEWMDRVGYLIIAALVLWFLFECFRSR